MIQSQVRDLIHSKICNNLSKLHDWYGSKSSALAYPIYSSYDVRDAGFKVGIVDANIFPAGFNNICPVDQETSMGLFKTYFDSHYSLTIKRILLITEEHTQNSYYWENVATIKKLLEGSGRQVKLAFPRNLEAPLNLQSASGIELIVYSGQEDSADVQNFKPDLIVSNNDFSDPKNEWAKSLSLPMNPPRGLGWYQRKKDLFFEFYNQLAAEFAHLIEIDPFFIQVKTEVFSPFDINDDSNLDHAAQRIDAMIADLVLEYKKHKIDSKPFIFVKNNSGTYGLGVIKVNSGEEFKNLNYKSRKKMKAAKGGREIEEVIIQEGIPSIVRADSATAEPVIYMIGCKLAGGFLRTHSEKSESESLNSPGAIYKRLCVSDLDVDAAVCPHENVYGWSAKLALLAIGLEAERMQVSYLNFKKGFCQNHQAQG
jgi:glutamate--cysteine ligase